MCMRGDVRRHRLVTLQTSGVTIHVRFQLRAGLPSVADSTSLGESEMHLVTGEAGKFAAAKTGRRLRAVILAAGHANHAIAPEAVLEKIRFGLANEIFLLSVIGSNSAARRNVAPDRSFPGENPRHAG